MKNIFSSSLSFIDITAASRAVSPALPFHNHIVIRFPHPLRKFHRPHLSPQKPRQRSDEKECARHFDRKKEGKKREARRTQNGDRATDHPRPGYERSADTVTIHHTAEDITFSTSTCPTPYEYESASFAPCITPAAILAVLPTTCGGAGLGS